MTEANSRSPDRLSLPQARRIALAAQGFDRPRPHGRVDVRHVRGVIRRLGLLQLDFVNVLIPSHYTILFSRLGPYERSLLDGLVYRRREFTEQWAHEASILPVESWPLLRHRMATHRVRPYGFEKLIEQQPEYVQMVLDEVRARGALAAEDIPAPNGISRCLPGSWFGTVPRAVLEAHFGRGLLAIANRLPNFTRTYDLAERVLPAEHHARTVDREEAQRELLLQAARAHGIGTVADLADYFRMPATQARPRIADLVNAGHLRPVQVEGWRETAYLHPDVRVPARMEGCALLSPFDPVIWFRKRAARLFEFDYRFEIFTPREKRRWGSYVLPFLLGDRLVARVDLKADRTSRRLLVLAAYRELHADPLQTANALAAELRSLASWLGFDSISVARRGDFARPLAAAVRAHSQPS
jgi:uncharacterized protein YcaQ